MTGEAWILLAVRGMASSMRVVRSCWWLLWVLWVPSFVGCAGSEGEAVDAGTGRDGAATDAGRVDGALPRDGSARGDGAVGDDGGVVVRDAGPETCGVERADTSSPPAGASWRYGGGVGYPDIVDPDGPCTTVVRTRAELEAAFEAAEADHVVYVADDARIDLTGVTLCIPGGVTLASGRGRDGNAGGLIYTTTTESRAALRTCGDDVRVTGLRMHGWEPTQCPPEWPDRCEGEDRTGGVNCRDCMPRSRGIQSRGFDRLEVDNVEMTGWTYGAVELRDSLDNHVHHSHLHHNQRQGLGYGVVLSNVTDPADALVEHNRFDYNRHSIAGSGAVGHSYEARNNLVLPHANGHVFDMHGIDEATGDGTRWAGTRILIHDNTVLPTGAYAVVIRGEPTEGAWIWDNCLARSSADSAAIQRRYYGGFHVDQSPSGSAPNSYGQSAADCEPLRFCTSSGGTGPWRYLARSSYGLSSLAVGDFDGDGVADVFRTDGTAWWWLSGGRGSWERLNTSGATLGSLAFGDFDGDGATDVFRTTGSQWVYSPGGSSPWATLNTSGATLGSLAFGDFDGDGATDVFHTTGSRWQYSSGGSSAWATLNTSSYTLGSLALADVDGDGTTDVIGSGGSRWRVSWGGRSGWEPLAVRDEPLSSVIFADFDGDSAADVFRTGCL